MSWYWSLNMALNWASVSRLFTFLEFADDLQHSKSSLVDRAVGPADVDQRAKRTFIRPSSLESMFERRMKLGRRSLALDLALDMARGRRRLCVEPGHGLDEGRTVDIQESRFRQRVANIPHRSKTGRDPAPTLPSRVRGRDCSR